MVSTKTEKKVKSVYIDKVHDDHLKSIADEEDRTVSQVLVRLISTYLDTLPEEELLKARRLL